MAEPDAREACGGVAGLAAEKSRQKARFSIDRQRRLQRVAMAEIVRLLGERSVRPSPPSSRSIRRRAASRPAISRSSEDLPAPLRPVTASASPAGDREIEAGKHLAAAPHAAQTASREPHLALHSPLSCPRARRSGVAQRICWSQCCSTIVGVAALLERFYKPGTLMQHTIGVCKPFGLAPADGVSNTPSPGIYRLNWDLLT